MPSRLLPSQLATSDLEAILAGARALGGGDLTNYFAFLAVKSPRTYGELIGKLIEPLPPHPPIKPEMSRSSKEEFAARIFAIAARIGTTAEHDGADGSIDSRPTHSAAPSWRVRL